MKEFIEHQPTDRPLTTEEEKLFEKFCSLHNTFAPRTCNVDGETIYEVAKGPFGDYQQVSETAYKKYEEEYLTSQRKEFLAQRLEAEKAKDHAKKLANVGGLHFHREYYSNLPYEKRLLEVMQQKQIPHMKEIPAYMEKQKEEITRFQGLAKREKKTDFYEQSILNFLEKYEKE
ncbi:MAG: hypothetical protein LBO09_03010 [Candidatus Peribacteria bacterium]|jgi:hypothetical protein|nr:hypothetical protein [Candidatus Peribacteria bacterium]